MTMMMELGEEDVAESKPKPIWEVKNLYLTFEGNTRILGIKPSDDTTETADLVTNCDLVKEMGYPVSMGLLFIDSKVYMIGGHRDHCKKLVRSHTESCASKSSISNEVYEFDNPEEPGGVPRLRPCASIPVLPTPMPCPVVVNIKGKTYVLYGESYYYRAGRPGTSVSDLENCFLLLEKNKQGNYEWSKLSAPPYYMIKIDNFRKTFLGVIGDKLCICWRRKVHCFDVASMEWGVLPPPKYIELGGFITLSVEEGHSVAVTAARFTHDKVDLMAFLLDGDGVDAQLYQVISEDTCEDYLVVAVKVFELREEAEIPNSATFCFVTLFHSYGVGYKIAHEEETQDIQGQLMDMRLLKKVKQGKLLTNKEVLVGLLLLGDEPIGVQKRLRDHNVLVSSSGY
ncbi:hypothetical protein LINPERPRIM_LOCUS19149 [Linum perenne]